MKERKRERERSGVRVRLTALGAVNIYAPPSIPAGFPGGSVVKISLANAGDLGLTPRSGRSPGGGNENPLQRSCLENPMDGGALGATDHGVAESWTF